MLRQSFIAPKFTYVGIQVASAYALVESVEAAVRSAAAAH